MESATLGVIFVGVWLGLVLLYCLFKACGGRFVDILSCDCFSGPCCDCWGISGRIDRYDREYPFQHDRSGYGQDIYTDPWGPYARPQPQLPPIVVVNSMKDRRDPSSDDEEDSDSPRNRDRRSRSVRPKRPGNPVSRDPERREEAGGALLLRSAGMNRSPDPAPGERQPVVV